MEKERKCRICNIVRDEDFFYKNDKTNRCKACEQSRKRAERKTRSHADIDRRKRLKKEYGITLEQFNEMNLAQNGQCAICGLKESMNRKNLCIDHCHESGMIRGLLCHACNVGLGHFNDNTKKLYNAIKYLKKWQK